ncbi:MAG: hypothetical protein WBF90_05655 [Rivularia sp. (in: cyanobacteria)]
MAQVKQKVYLITEQQRDALLNYFLERPYKEVANGVQFLNNAPTTTVNVEVPEEQLKNISAQQKSETQVDTIEELKVQTATPSAEETLVFSHA